MAENRHARMSCTAVGLAGLCCLLLMSGCSKAPDRGLDDTSPPALRCTSPFDGEQSVQAESCVMAVFDEPIDTTAMCSCAMSVQADGVGIGGDIAVNTDTLLFTPHHSLAYSTCYRVILADGISDLWGNSIEQPDTFSFTTEPAPQGCDRHSLTVINPNGGEVFRIGDTMAIVVAMDSTDWIQAVYELSVDNGVSWVMLNDDTTIALKGAARYERSFAVPESVTCDRLSYQWTVSGQCRVWVHDYEPEKVPASDKSDRAFAIVESGSIP